VGSLITGGISGLAGLATLGNLFSGGDGFTPQAPTDPSNPLVINQYGQPGPVNPNGGLGGFTKIGPALGRAVSDRGILPALADCTKR
jgi:hypothetical protein